MAQNIELTEWVKTFTKELLSWAVHKTSNVQVAEDLVQDTFLVAAEKFHTFRKDSQPKTWLFGILNNKIAEYHRMKIKINEVSAPSATFLELFFDEHEHWKKEFSPIDWHADEQHLLDDEDFLQVFYQCMDKLPDQWRACLELKFLEEKDSPKVCQDLGVSPTNYWQMMHRAKLSMRQCIEQNWFRKEMK